MGIETKAKINSKINDQIKESLYNWIIHHPQVVQSPIVNDCMKVNTDGHNEPQLSPKLLLQVYALEIQNSLVSDTEDCGLKEVREAENDIIISNSTLRSLLPPQLKNVIKIQPHVWLWMFYI